METLLVLGVVTGAAGMVVILVRVQRNLRDEASELHEQAGGQPRSR
ncbi:MAG: hypothetical protein ACF8R9_10035 [Phycisphaerales bacterium JB054]